MRVLIADGDQVAVDGMDWSTRTGGIAYNLTVADLHTYFVVVGDDEVLVHNTCGSSNYWKGTRAEQRAGIPDGPKERFTDTSQKDWIPDHIDHQNRVVVEVKDLQGTFDYTQQIKAYQDYAKAEKYTFIICTDSPLSAPLQAEVTAERIKLRTIDGCRAGKP